MICLVARAQTRTPSVQPTDEVPRHSILRQRTRWGSKYRQVSVMIVVSESGALAAKATPTIPIVFGIAEDPVALGLVANIARPGGNATGVNFLMGELVPKRMGILRELVPAATRFGVLVNPGDRRRAEATAREAQAAARSMERQVHVLEASTSGEIDEAFGTFARERTEALFIGPDT